MKLIDAPTIHRQEKYVFMIDHLIFCYDIGKIKSYRIFWGKKINIQQKLMR